MTAPDRFHFLGEEHAIVSAKDWNHASWPKLWLYNAHYFDDLAAKGSSERSVWHTDILARWIAENPPACGNGWEPYPTSLRIVNWVKWAMSGKELGGPAHHSLAVQARWLSKRLELHLQGNHLWANGKALVFAGAYFEGEQAEAWRRQGLAILQRELHEQILPDGGHFERSPMYHAIVLEDVLDLVQLASAHNGLFPPEEVARWRDTVARMLRWLRVMSHPDGGIALFNDAALGIAPDVAALADYAAALGLSVDLTPLADIEALSDSGYVRLRTGPAVLIADVAPIGPDHLPGHAHADTLSFELSLHGRRMMVNGGTSTYDVGDERLRQRSTSMHNTVAVDAANSSEVWSSFRVARRARPLGVTWGHESERLWIEAGHDGYLRLPGKVIHRRRWELKANGLRVVDKLTGRFCEAKAYFRFAPGLPAACALTNGSPVTVPGKWYPRFGASEDCQVLEVSFAGASLDTSFAFDACQCSGADLARET